MGMEGSGAIPVLQFDGEGYEIWCKKMKTLFVSLGLWNIVQQGYQNQDKGGLGKNRKKDCKVLDVIQEANTSMEIIRDQSHDQKQIGYEEEATDMGGSEEDIKKDCKALYLIQQGVSDSLFPVIMKSNTSKEAWEAIRDRFYSHPRREDEIKREIKVNIDGMFLNLNPIYEERCIFRVPHALRFGNEEFYEPKVLSIGPYHRGKPRLASMEEHKVRYLKDLLQRMGMQSMDLFVRDVIPQEMKVRKCYAESIESVSSVDLIQMLVLDGCFIIELFRRMENRHDQHYCRWFQERENHRNLLRESNYDYDSHAIKNDPVINSDVMLNALQNDLLLIENQIPFFIIKILFDIISSGKGDSDNSDRALVLARNSRIMMLKTLILAFLCRKYLIYELLPQINNINLDDMCHLLDIAHKTLCPPIKKRDEVAGNSKEFTFRSFNDETFCFVDSATKLEEANVTLKAIKNSIGGNIFDINFDKGILLIPSFAIDYHIEFDIRNFIALELCLQDRENRYLCDYVVFMDHLIASSEDVELLIRRDIITNQMIDANFVDNMFKKLTKNIVTSDPYTYYETSTRLNKYCAQRKNKWSAGLKQKYFQSPWTFISIVAASMLLALTFTQTWYSIISYYK